MLSAGRRLIPVGPPTRRSQRHKMMSASFSSARPRVAFPRPTRRQLLQVGGAGLFGLSLPGLLAAAERNAGRKARARAVIFLHQFGGPSQTDTFDMKPAAPDNI